MKKHYMKALAPLLYFTFSSGLPVVLTPPSTRQVADARNTNSSKVPKRSVGLYKWSMAFPSVLLSVAVAADPDFGFSAGGTPDLVDGSVDVDGFPDFPGLFSVGPDLLGCSDVVAIAGFEPAAASLMPVVVLGSLTDPDFGPADPDLGSADMDFGFCSIVAEGLLLIVVVF
jgi:hypothetical protein